MLLLLLLLSIDTVVRFGLETLSREGGLLTVTIVLDSPNLGCRLGTPVSELTVHQLHQLFDAVTRAEMFREQVCRVRLPGHLSQLDRASAHSFLHPECVCLDVSQFAEA